MDNNVLSLNMSITIRKGVSNHWTGIWNGMMEWKMDWNGECSQLQQSCGAVQSRLSISKAAYSPLAEAL